MKLYKIVIVFLLLSNQIFGIGGSKEDIKNLKIYAEEEGFNTDEDQSDLSFINGESDLLQGDYNDVRLTTLNQEKLKDAIQNYKIHLMPRNNFLSIAQKLVRALKNDEKLQELIFEFKFLKVENLKKITEDEPQEDIKIEIIRGHALLTKRKVVAPLVVIYPSSGKENVQKALNKLYEIFKGTPGIDVAPRYNEKITDLIFVAQGNASEKESSHLEYFFEKPDMVYFDYAKLKKLDFLPSDAKPFGLENPAEKEEEKKGKEEKEEELVTPPPPTPAISPASSTERKQEIFGHIKTVLKRHPWIALLGGAALLRLAVWMYKKFAAEAAATANP